MSSSRQGKRKLKKNNYRIVGVQPFKRPKYDEKFPIMDRVQSQKGLRRQLVIFESSFDVPFSVLQNAVDRIKGVLTIKNVEKNKSSGKFQLVVNKELLAEETFENLTEARKGLAELALDNLRKSCFTIFRKIHPRDSPKVNLTSPSCSDTSTANVDNPPPAPPQTNIPSVGGIGAKMMLQMGWAGGGLGAKEQGRTSIVQPYIQIQRQGLGTKNIKREVTRVLQDYGSSRDINAISFSSDFTKEERVVIHEVARKLNLKSKSYGKDADRILVVQSKVKPWDLIYSLLESGGESEQLKLILPTDFDK